MSDEPWYGVRCVFEHPDEDPVTGEHWYEERVTLWRAETIDEAISLADAEADEYTATIGCGRTALVQAFHIASPTITSGSEVFSLIRGSTLDADDYLDAFFDTGTELQGDAASEAAPASPDSSRR